MSDKEELFQGLIGQTEEYVKTHIELLKLYTIDKVSTALSSIVALIIILFVCVVFLMVLNLGIGLWLGDILGSLYMGFFILALFYGVMALLLYAFRDKWIIKPLVNKIILELLK